jgi:hypothetical protein
MRDVRDVRDVKGVVRRVLVLAGGGAVVLVLVAAGMHLYASARRNAFIEAGAQAAPVRVTDLGVLPPEVRESSGLAVSRAHPGTFWTHNDSGDRPRLYALDSTASLVATFEVADAEARDWEALDIGACPGGLTSAAWCLYVGDTGDNARRRDHVTVYVVAEPDPADSSQAVDVIARVRFRYEGGPFDAEALAVTPAGDLVIATKGRAPAMWVFTMPADTVVRYADGERVAVLTDPVRLPVEPEFRLGRWLTGGSLDGSGSILALRTYTEVYFYRWPMADVPEPVAETCFLGLIEPNGEAIAFSGEEGRLFLTSESPGRLRGHLLEIECSGVGG